MAFILTSVSGLLATAVHAEYEFTDVTDSAGVADLLRSHFGATWSDYDGDGLLDLLSVNGNGRPGGEEDINTLFHNNGDGTFTDVTTESGAGDPFVAMRNIWADYDRDGDLDFYSHNFQQSTLYQNNGNLFTDVNATSGAGLNLSNGTGAAWADFDRDGWLDLHAIGYPNGENVLLHNNGDGTFTNIQDSSSLPFEANGMGNAVADYNNDGLPDIAVAAVTSLDTVFLSRQNTDGTFSDVTQSAGIVVEDGSSTSTISWADYDNDGRLDLFIGEVTLGSLKTTPERVYLFHNIGRGRFEDVTTAAGIIPPASATDFWDAGFADYDNDGDLDLYLGATNAPNQLWENQGDGTFVDVAADKGVDLIEEGKGVTWGDYDNDGDLDLYVSQRAAFGADFIPNVLFENNGGSNRWLQVTLIGTCSNPDAIGARLTLTTDDGKTQIREINGGTGLFSQFSPIQQFGLGPTANPSRFSINWPNGFRQTLGGRRISAGQHLIIRESQRCTQ